MGWRAWDHYEQDAERQQRMLPWRERFDWRGVLIFMMIVALAGAYLWAKFQ